MSCTVTAKQIYSYNVTTV